MAMLLASALVALAMGSAMAKPVSQTGLDLDFEQVGGLVHTGRSFSTELYTKSQNEKEGNTVTKLREKYSGIPVEHHELMVRQHNGKVKSVIGTVLSSAPASLEASVDAVAAVQALYPGASILKAAEVVIYEHDGVAYLAHKTLVTFLSDDGKAHFGNVYTDATTGSLVNFETKKYGGMQRETFRYPEVCADFDHVLNYLPGDLKLSDSMGMSSTDDERATWAHDNSKYVYDYLSYFMHDSIDGMGMPIVSSVQATYSQYSGDDMPMSYCSGDNAFWLGEPFSQMVYLVDGVLLCNIESGTDVVGHEMSHGVTDTSSQLVYQDESGAINEAFSDIMGAGVEMWRDNGCQAGTGCPFMANENNFLLGEQAICANNPYGMTALRFMSNPTLDGYSVDNYDDLMTGPEDSGGVHGNSGILNLQFYLMSMGGSHPRPQVSTVQVPPLGPAISLILHFYSNTMFYTPYTDFHMARQLMTEASIFFWGGEPATIDMVLASVNASFDAVRVFDSVSGDSCQNHMQDSDEDGIDCGGKCLECSGSPCFEGMDCLSGMCIDTQTGNFCGSGNSTMPSAKHNKNGKHHSRTLLFGPHNPCACA